MLFLAESLANGSTQVTAIGLRLSGADLKAVLAETAKTLKVGASFSAGLSVANAGNATVTGGVHGDAVFFAGCDAIG